MGAWNHQMDYMSLSTPYIRDLSGESVSMNFFTHWECVSDQSRCNQNVGEQLFYEILLLHTPQVHSILQIGFSERSITTHSQMSTAITTPMQKSTEVCKE